MQYVLPVPPAMFQLCGGDVFMSDFKGLNIFSKSLLWSLCSCVLFNYLLLAVDNSVNVPPSSSVQRDFNQLDFICIEILAIVV